MHQRTILTMLLMLFLTVSICLKVASINSMTRNRIADKARHGLGTVEKKEVLLLFDNWTRYKLNSSLEWAALYPGNGVVRLGPSQDPYTVSMMHQLRCLDQIRQDLTQPKYSREIGRTRHCMNYLRETLMCRGDTMLDAYQYTHKIKPVRVDVIRRCHDWREVYQNVAENQRGWL
ncbi:hypothetical protein PsYK624_085270 [Phanerochaete sordida]|uniref:Uncharacterized protein n=1 Tax=Phanerochaete sordida TaxID=48140 RepID=A0A9P3GAD5_9APHY|nr:hypothetical protein PsYK624_085270 [Phanerochaete sordida]